MRDEREATERLCELKAAMDDLADETEHDGEPSAEELRLFAEAIAHFRAAGPRLLAEATPFLREYYQFVAAEFTAEERAEYGVPEISPDEDIWAHVSFERPPTLEVGGGHLEPGLSYLSFEGEVSWEPEHGLQLVVEHGQKVCKVGPYDGHNTVAHAYGDESLLGVVFR